MLKIDHLTSDRLAEVLKGARLDSAQAYHVEHCGECRRTLTASLLAGRLGRSGGEPFAGRHVDSGGLNWLHGAAYEYEQLGDRGLTEFVATLRHLNKCDACFARFFALHQALTPSQQAVEGAISRFEHGQRVRRVGTLVVTRSLERLRQTFLPARPLSAGRATSDDHSLVAALARLKRGEADLSEFEDLPGPAASSGAPSASLESWASMDEPAPPVPEYSRVSASIGSPLGPAASAEDLREAAERHARQLANLMQDEASEIARFRKALTASGRLTDKAQALRDLVRDFERLSGVMEAHESEAETLRAAMRSLRAELDRIAELEQRQRTLSYEAEPEYVYLPGVSLEITAWWSGETGWLAVVARDSETDEPRPGVELTPQAANYAPSAAAVSTDSAGQARVALHAGTTGLRIASDPSAKPWLIGIEVRERHPLR